MDPFSELEAPEAMSKRTLVVGLIFVIAAGVGVLCYVPIAGESERRQDADRKSVRDSGGSDQADGDSREDAILRRIISGDEKRLPQPSTEVSRLVREAIRRRGDYQPAEILVRLWSEEEAFSLLRGWVVGVRSPRGVDYDFDHQGALIQAMPTPLQDRLRMQLIQGAAKSSLDELAVSERVPNLGPDEFKLLCKAVAKDSTERALRVAELSRDSSVAEASVVVVVRESLGIDSMSAGRAIGAMTQGRRRDLAIQVMVEWLLSRDSFKEAHEWIEEIGDVDMKNTIQAQIAAMADETH